MDAFNGLLEEPPMDVYFLCFVGMGVSLCDALPLSKFEPVFARVDSIAVDLGVLFAAMPDV